MYTVIAISLGIVLMYAIIGLVLGVWTYIVGYDIEIADGDIIVLNTINYSVIHADDIGNQGKVVQVPVKRIENGP